MIPVDAPDLADAYAEAAPRDERDAPLPGWGLDPGLSERYGRRVRLGYAGAGTMLAGIGVATVGGVVYTVGVLECLDVALSGSGACASQTLTNGAILLGVGVVTAGVGEVVMFTGAIGAANDGRALGLGTSPTLGWVGVGLIAGGAALNVTGALTSRDSSGDSPLSTAGGLLGMGGAICGAVQLGQVARVGRRSGVVLVPAPGGLGLAGRLGRPAGGR